MEGAIQKKTERPWNIICGDALAVLKTLESESVQCCVTSPPYFGLRDYGIDGQIGLETTPQEFVAKLVNVFLEVRRVMKKDATLWLNLGDSYNSSNGGNSNGIGKSYGHSVDKPGTDRPSRVATAIKREFIGSLKPKDLMGMPWRVAFALQEAGFWLRQDIIWSKPNPMPESVTDRCTKAHEYLFLLSKSSKYYFDAYSIATPYQEKTLTTFGIESTGYGDGSGLVKSENWARDVKTRKPKEWKMPDGWDTGDGGHGSFHREGREKGAKGNAVRSDRANRRSVWTVNTQPCPEAHFATFPKKLIEPCILAGSRDGDIVLDPFAGAGTTGLVAVENRRRFLGIELNPEYIEIAERRIGNVQVRLI